VTTDQLIYYIVLAVLPILSAITLHEAAHGYMARHFGDHTAEREGRITLNPLRHIDPVGTVLVPILTLTLSMAAGGLFIFGWAKPVPVNFGALHNPKKDMLWVSLAGPAANLFMALVWGVMAWLGQEMGDNYFAQPLYAMAVIGIQINAVLMVLNLIPLPPLDGGRIAVSLLPMPQAVKLARIEPYGMIILITLLATGVLGAILWPVVNLVNKFIYFIFGI